LISCARMRGSIGDGARDGVRGLVDLCACARAACV